MLPETVSTYDRLLVSVTLEKREGACALFVQKTPDRYWFFVQNCTQNWSFLKVHSRSHLRE